MAQKHTKCGETELSYDEDCEYWCSYSPGKGYSWGIRCTDANGKVTGTYGTGLEVAPPDGTSRPRRVSFDGPAAGFAQLVLEQTGQRVRLPEGAADRRLTFDVDGDWAEAIAASGLEREPRDDGDVSRGGPTIDRTMGPSG